jgi:hypothetical protein
MADQHDPSPQAVDPADEHLWSLLRRTVHEPVPDDVRAAALEAFRWRDPDAQLAVLVADSADPERERLAPVRDAGQARLLTFVRDDISLDIEVDERADSVDLVGQLAPVGPGEIVVDHGAQVTRVQADALGRFHVHGVTRGPVRLRCTLQATGTTVQTEWVLL